MVKECGFERFRIGPSDRVANRDEGGPLSCRWLHATTSEVHATASEVEEPHGGIQKVAVALGEVAIADRAEEQFVEGFVDIHV